MGNEDEDEDNDEHETSVATEWVSLVDLGKLWHIKMRLSCSFVLLKRPFTLTSPFQPSVIFNLARKVPSLKPSMGTMMWLSTGA